MGLQEMERPELEDTYGWGSQQQSFFTENRCQDTELSGKGAEIVFIFISYY